MTEESLSKKWAGKCDDEEAQYYWHEDVKEAVKRLKEVIPVTLWGTIERNRIEAHEEIDKIFGSKLIGGKTK